jgi:hypothetical protein
VISASAFPALVPEPFDLSPDEIKARMLWASRQGQPHWLWPEVSVAEWVAALESIAAIAREVMTQNRSVSILDGNATAVAVAAFTSGMGPLLGHWQEVGKLNCAGPVASVLELQLRHNRLRMERMAERAAKISHALTQNDIAHTLLKGMHTAYSYFPEPGVRPLSDIDLLVARMDRRRAETILRRSGFEPGATSGWPAPRNWQMIGSPKTPRSLYLVHADETWSIDLHASLNRRYAAAAPLVRLDDTVRVAQVSRSTYAPGAQFLDQPSLLLHLAVHASCGLDSLTMIRLTELALVIRKDMSVRNAAWNAFLDAAVRAGAVGVVYPALRLCDQLLPGTVPSWVTSRSRAETTPAVRRVVDPLTPANAQGLLRCSLAERFMWAPSPLAVMRQALEEVFPPGSGSLPALLAIYRTRMWRLARGTLTQ